jgi:hypothetical protein
MNTGLAGWFGRTVGSTLSPGIDAGSPVGVEGRIFKLTPLPEKNR